MALIAVCLTVTFVICGRANEGSGGLESKVREGRMAWQVKAGGKGSECGVVVVVWGGLYVLISCVSVADLLVRKQIFSLSDSINLPHLS